MGKKNLFHFDEIRFLMIHLIIINHWVVDRSLVKTGIDDSLVRFWFELTSPTLAVISGYLFFYGSAERFEYRRKVKSRISSLVIPYLVWCTFFFVVINGFKLVYGFIFHENFWVHPVDRLTFVNYLRSLVVPPLANFWYLQNLILIIPLCYGIYYLLKNRWVFLATLTAVILLYWNFQLPLYFSARFLPYYLVGCYMGYYHYQLPKIKMNPGVALLLVPVIYSVTWLPVGTAALQVCRLAMVLIFLFLAYNFMDTYKESWLVRYLQRNAEHSFLIFCSNIFILSVTEKGMLKLGLGRWLENKYYTLFFHLAALVITLTAIILFGRWLKNHFHRVYSLISGHRVGAGRR